MEEIEELGRKLVEATMMIEDALGTLEYIKEQLGVDHPSYGDLDFSSSDLDSVIEDLNGIIL